MKNNNVRSRFICLCATVLCLAAPASFQAQSKADIDRAVGVVDEAGKSFIRLIRDLTDEQWHFKSSILQRSIGEEAEHVALAEHELLTKVIAEAVKAPAQPEAAKKLAGKEKKIRDLMLNPDEPAERYKPKGRLKTKAEVIEFFERSHRETMKALKSTPDLGLHVKRHPHKDYQELTTLQWFYYMAYHNQRHCKQIEQIMADAMFPGGAKQAD